MGRMTYRERRERRAARRDEWAEKRDKKAEEAFAGADRIADGYPMGQPILVGHHSEKRHRRDLERVDRGMRRGFEHRNMAKHHRQQADGIRRQLDTSIYSDDHDAIERLRERIAEREAKRDRWKLINRTAAKIGRQHGIKRTRGHWSHLLTDETRETLQTVLVETCKAVKATRKEIADLAGNLHHGGALAFDLTNIGARIRRDRKRLARLEREAAAD